MIGDGVPQDAIEPGDGGLAIAECRETIEPSREGVLKEILGERPAAYTPLDERDEGEALIDEPLRDRLLYFSSVVRVIARHNLYKLRPISVLVKLQPILRAPH